MPRLPVLLFDLTLKQVGGGWETPEISSGLIIVVMVHRTQGNMFASLF